MQYPKTPPITEAREQSIAKKNHFLGTPSDIAANKTSGGTGKKLDSEKLNKHNAAVACLVSAQ
jgi:hypothetical protein